MSKHHKTSLGNISLYPIAVLSMACSSGEVNLGGGTVTQDLTQASRCAESPTLSGDVHIATQSELDALTGCEEITGSLRIEIIEGVNLAPLAALRVVGEAFDLGADAINVPEDPDEQQEFFDRRRALEDAGWLESLDGLQALQSVGTLYLTALLVEDLTELESLGNITLGLVGRSLHNLRNLTGLESVTLPFLWIMSGEALESLDGLQLNPNPNGVMLEQVPALTNIDALVRTTTIEGALIISGTGLASLPDLQLTYAGSVSIAQNLLLVDASGLSALGGTNDLYFAANPSLRSLPDLRQLTYLDSLTVLGNDALEEVSLNFPLLEPQVRYIQQRVIQLPPILIDIGINAGLRRITSPASFDAIQLVGIYQNPSLTDIDLGRLARADLLAIEDNPALHTIAAPSLATVDALVVINNPELVPSAFDDVQTFTREISGNASAGAP